MTLFGKRFSDYVAFCAPMLVLISVVGILRLGLSLGGVPNETARWISMTVVVWIAVFYYSVRIHTSGFGSYKQLLVVCALLNVVSQLVSITGILTSVLSGSANIYSAPEYSFGGGNQWIHAGAHLTIGMIAGSLFPWVVGSLILFVTKKLTNSEAPAKSAA